MSLDARPESGQGMASGDVVNTGARLQAAAAVNGILVDQTTYRATERAIVFEEAAPVEAKGKREPVPVFRAVETRARYGVDITEDVETPAGRPGRASSTCSSMRSRAPGTSASRS